MSADDLFEETAREIFTQAGISIKRNPERFVEAQLILRERAIELNNAFEKEKCSLEEKSSLWHKQISDLISHLQCLLIEGEVSP